MRRLVFVGGVFHRDGWEDGVLDDESPEFFRQSYAELSPDGIGHYDVVVAKLAGDARDRARAVAGSTCGRSTRSHPDP